MIITFYSYKGGTGRSTALVNVAEVFSQAGLRVLIVDFDLEAPSLETYYPDKTDRILDFPGIIDLIYSYKRAISMPAPLRQAAESNLPFARMVPISVSEDADKLRGGRVDLLSVGRRSADSMPQYVNLVRGLDWRDFYANWEGELFFRWLQKQFHAHADVTLVDCPTGIKDAGMICCGQLSDIVAVFCAASSQQLAGCEMMASRLRAPRLIDVRGTAPIFIGVPTMINTSMWEARKEFRARFEHTFKDFQPKDLSAEDLWDTAIPFDAAFGFGAHIVTREMAIVRDRLDALLSPAWAYRRLAAILAGMAPRDTRLFDASCTLAFSNTQQ